MDFDKAIKINNSVFGYSDTYSNIKTWENRHLYKIYFVDDSAFMAIEKRNDTFHIWLIGSQVSGSGKQLFKMMSDDIMKEGIIKITVSTIPEKFTIMYSWLKRIGFVEDDEKTIMIDGKKKVYMSCGVDQFFVYVNRI